MKASAFAGILILYVVLGTAAANVATISLAVPDEVAAGDEVTVEMEIRHLNNDRDHYVDWVRLYMDGELLQGWNYDSTNHSDETRWTLTYTTVVERETVFKAEVNCNLHGGRDDSGTVRIDGGSRDDDGGATAYLLVALGIPVLIVVIVLLRRR